ncbi:G-protein coupled receptor 61-like [Gigantopelta aegis]|uniref:G-protein coupled receptor 61-like n=1 Tax=Gigantopelta aegis TaxID=1735272 RepID=UPI001B88C54D|nr:G-protein coupled receptor 61-like [Gigantopelta aegis]
MNDSSFEKFTLLDQIQNISLTNYVIVGFMCFINIMAIFGNMSVIFAIGKSSDMRHRQSNLFILNLSVVDFIASVVTLPVSICTFHTNARVFDSMWCAVSGFLAGCVIYASIGSLCAISIERVYYIKWPLHHEANLTVEKTYLVLFVIWLQCITVALPPVFKHLPQHSDKDCYSGWQGVHMDVFYVSFIGVWCFLIPVLVMLLSHCGIFNVIRKFSPLSTFHIVTVSGIVDTRLKAVSHRSSLLLTQRSVKNFFFLIVHLLAFVILWGPYFVFAMYHALHAQPEDRDKMVDLVVTWLGFVTFAANPVLYGLMNRPIRTQLVEWYEYIFCCDFLRKRKANGEQLPEETASGEEDFLHFLGITPTANNT